MGFKDYKIIILDECDYITPNVTSEDLRNLMETFSKHCRFIYCNFVERIIDDTKSLSIISGDTTIEEGSSCSYD